MGTMLAEEVPKDTVVEAIKAFEDAFNANDMKTAASLFADTTLVKLNGGYERGGPFTGKTPKEVEDFLLELHTKMSVTNMRFTVVDVADNVHTDTWKSDAGTGSSSATWAQDEEGNWKITKDDMTFIPGDVNDQAHALEGFE